MFVHVLPGVMLALSALPFTLLDVQWITVSTNVVFVTAHVLRHVLYLGVLLGEADKII